MNKFLPFIGIIFLLSCQNQNTNSTQEERIDSPNPQIGILINVFDHDYEKIEAGTFQSIKKIGYNTIELGNYNKPFSEKLSKIYFNQNFNTFASGASLWPLQNGLDTIIEKAKALNEEFLVCYWPWLDGADNLTRGQCIETAKMLNAIGKICNANGLKFAFHNHGVEFKEVDGELACDIILAHSDPKYVSLELDLYHMINAGANPLEYIKKHSDRISILHLFTMNNSSENPIVGEGMENFEEIILTSKKLGVKHFVVEGNDLKDPLAYAERSYTLLEDLLIKSY